MSDTRSAAGYPPRRRRHRKRDQDADQSDGSGYSSAASDTASRATTARSSRSGAHRHGRGGDALVVREQYHIQRPPGARRASEYSDDGYDEYTVGGDGGGGRGRRQGYREKEDRGLERERGLLILVAAFVVGLVFCLRETRSHSRR